MKFAAGYLLGAGTVIAIGASFFTGVVAKTALDQKVDETLIKTRQNAAESVLSMFKTKQN